jgi:Leucine-rich repeat (LRR) protein
MMKIAREGGKWDMAEPLREEIVQDYKDDEDPTIKNNEWLETMPTLVLNLSWPHIQLLIDQMTMFKGIKTLIITCDRKGTPVDLEKILKNAVDYPLEDLYIINFGSSVSVLPECIGNFSSLTHVGLFNDNINQLPSSFSNLTGIQTLYLDINPVSSIIGEISQMKKLSELGIAQTKISADEISKISKLIPTCKITTE